MLIRSPELLTIASLNCLASLSIGSSVVAPLVIAPVLTFSLTSVRPSPVGADDDPCTCNGVGISVVDCSLGLLLADLFPLSTAIAS